MFILPDNPLVGGTAHLMMPNSLPHGTDIKKTMEELKANNSLNHFRFFPSEDGTLVDYAMEVEKFHNRMAELDIKVINIGCEKFQGLIGFLRSHYEYPHWQKNMNKVKQHCLGYWPSFLDGKDVFADKMNSWHDLREAVAFRVRPYEHWKLWESKTTNKKNVYEYAIGNFISNPTEEIKKIFKFLGLDLNQSKLKEWISVQEQWRTNLDHYVDFCDDLEEIVYKIVNNQDMDLKKYQMNVLKEAVLLHFLIYKHNLNLNTKAETLPANTKNIFQLLCPNDSLGISRLCHTMMKPKNE
jgi:hypothetical protein